MIAGFAAFHSIFPSKLALLCCLYAGGYETYFVVSGTIADESAVKTKKAHENAGVSWLREQVARNKAEYERVKARYETAGTKEHMNGWYKRKYLDPKWEAYSDAQTRLSNAIKRADSNISFDHVTLLKIFYRLGLVALLMLLVHQSLNLALLLPSSGRLAGAIAQKNLGR